VTYRVEVDARAVRELLRLPKQVVERIRETILALSKEPRPPGASSPEGRDSACGSEAIACYTR